MPVAATLDSVRALACESPTEGGTEARLGPTELTTTADALAAAGLYIDGPSVTQPDKTVLIDRTSSGMRFTDAASQQQLSNIVGAAYNGYQAHAALPDASHLDSFGPDVGLPSGCYEQRIYSGPLLTSVTWYTSSQMTQKVYSVTLTYSGPLVSTITRTTYTSSGVLARTLVDALNYGSGPLLTGRTRTWT